MAHHRRGSSIVSSCIAVINQMKIQHISDRVSEEQLPLSLRTWLGARVAKKVDSQHTSPPFPGSPQNSEPLLPQSPDSLSQGEVLESHHPNTVTIDTSDRIHPASLHLKPVMRESLAEITLPSTEPFEVVYGLLVWIPMGSGTAKHQRITVALVELINLSLKWRAVSGVDVEVESISGNIHDANSRAPSIVIAAPRPGSPSASSSSSERISEKLVLLTKDKPAYAQIEITGESTRATCLTTKWEQYCHTGINFYCIIDQHGRRAFDEERVIAGSKARIQAWTRCNNDDPDGASSSATPNTQMHGGVYTGNSPVQGRECVKVILQDGDNLLL